MWRPNAAIGYLQKVYGAIAFALDYREESDAYLAAVERERGGTSLSP